MSETTVFDIEAHRRRIVEALKRVLAPLVGEVRRSIDLRLLLECVVVTSSGAAVCRVVDNPRALPLEIPAELWDEYEAAEGEDE